MDVERIGNKAKELDGEVREIRRHLHAYPEIAWQEVETTRYIVSKLEEYGFKDIKVGADGEQVGAVADLVGDPSGPCVALRTDIDALPLTEENSVEYKSRNEGAMHACGHDAHMAMLLGAAKLLSSMKEELPGKVRFIFQPAEEHGLRSGADAMIREGVLEGVDAIGGMHLWSHVPSGRVQWRSGPVMASADKWEVEFTGKGGHGAMPQNAIDPTLAAANMIMAMQTIISREIDPLQTAVISIGQLVSGEVINIIPNSAYLMGNTRTFDIGVRNKMEERIRRIADGVAAAYRCTAETRYTSVYPNPVINDKTLALLFRDTAERVVGEENVEETPMLMTSEDFNFYQVKIPGNFFFLGCGNAEKGTDRPHHSPRFDVDEDVLPTGISLLASFACSVLEDPKALKR